MKRFVFLFIFCFQCLSLLYADNKSFVIFVTSSEDKALNEKTLESIAEQDYDDYRIFYFTPPERSLPPFLTNHKISITQQEGEELITIIQNENSQLENLYCTALECKEDDIFVTMAAGDTFAHQRALQELNELYTTASVWCSIFADLEIKDAFVNGQIRNSSLRPASFNSFYAGILQRIKLQDLTLNSQYYESDGLLAMMLPIFEMTKEHMAFVSENLIKVGSELEATTPDLASHIRKLASYAPLSVLHASAEFEKDQADIIAFSYNRPIQLQAFLESLEKHVKNINHTYIIYRVGSFHYENAYKKLADKFTNVTFIAQSRRSSQRMFQPLFEEVAFKKSKSNFIVFATDDIIVKDTIDLKKDMRLLRQTKAYGVYYRLGNHVDYCYTMDMNQGIPPTISLGNDTYAWEFSKGKCDWNYPNTVDMTLYYKPDIKSTLQALTYHNPNTLEDAWSYHQLNTKLGLYYKLSKVVNIPLNVVQENWQSRNMKAYTPEQLLRLFIHGQKIDITPLHQIKNRSAHEEIEVKFVSST